MGNRITRKYDRRKREAIKNKVDINCNQCEFLRFDQVSYSFDKDSQDLQKETRRFCCEKGEDLYIYNSARYIIRRRDADCIDCHSFYNAYEKGKYVPLMRAGDIKQMYSIWLDWMTWPLRMMKR